MRKLLFFSAATAFTLSAYSADDFSFNTTSGDWDDPVFWTNINVGAGNNDRFVNNGGTAIIEADTSLPIRDLKVALGGSTVGQVDHIAGTHATGSGNWAFIGVDGGRGTYNLGDTGGSDGLYSGISTGEGTLRVANNTDINLANSGRLYVGTGSSGSVGVFNMNTTGSLLVGNDIVVGQGAGTNGTLNLDNGTISGGDGWHFIGTDNGTGTMRVSGGTVNFGRLGGNRTYVGGSGGTGNLIVSGGVINAYGLKFGDNVDRGGGLGQGNGTITGGTINAADHLQLGRGGSRGTVNQSGGTVNVNGGWFGISNDSNVGGSSYNISGGALNLNGTVGAEVGADAEGSFSASGTGQVVVNNANFSVGFRANGNGTLNMSGNSSLKANNVVLGANAGATGTINANGGTIEAHTVGVGAGTITAVNFNGTTFKARSAQGEYFPGVTAANSELQGGGVTINTNGNDISTGVAFDGPGGLTKTGEGKLTLNGLTTFTGGLNVQQGTVALGATGGIVTNNINVASGASLDLSAVPGASLTSSVPVTGNGTINGNLTVSETGTLSPGNSIGVLNITGDLTLLGTSLFELDMANSPNSDQANVTGVLNFGGDLTITNIGGSILPGTTFDLFDYASSTGAFANISWPDNKGWQWVNNIGVDGSITFIPEPTSASLVGLALMAFGRRRRK